MPEPCSGEGVCLRIRLWRCLSHRIESSGTFYALKNEFLPLSLTLWLGGLPALAQESFFVPVEPGPHVVGYQDTVLYNLAVQYDHYGYSGPAPLFISTWFPMEGKDGQQAMVFGEFRDRVVPATLIAAYEAMKAGMDQAAVEYYLLHPIDDDRPIDYGTFTHREVLDTLRTFLTRSHRATLGRKLDAPVIVYHHGSQGLKDENHMMAEYFASRGYGFVSSNFHWPIEGQVYGTPLTWAPDHSAMEEVVAYARSLTASDSIFFIGHSWGAQQGWCALSDPGPVKAFVSMETTLEWKTDTNEIKDKWAEMYDVLKTQHTKVPIPVLLFADADLEGPFPFFVGCGSDTLWHADAFEPFAHESYTSSFLMRLLFKDRFPQTDAFIMEQQMVMYAAHLETMAAFFRHIRTGVAFPDKGTWEVFQVHRTVHGDH